MSDTFSIEVELTDTHLPQARRLKVKVRREQVPLTITTASTLYTLQRTTAEPGLIYYYRTPRRVSNVMKWISCYMALSRVRSLQEFRGIGLTPAIREFIDNGPPEGVLTRFLEMFEDKMTSTEEQIEEALREPGWTDEC